MRPTRNRRRVVVRLAAVATFALTFSIARAPHADAHTRLAGTSPAAGGVVESLPADVSIAFAAKPATVEGDPLLVYDATGNRIDDGDVRVAGDGRELSIGLAPGPGRPGGRYDVLYRVVSADSHVLTGRFSFTVAADAPAVRDRDLAAAPEHHHAVQVRRGLRSAGPADLRPEVLTAGATAMVTVGALRRVRRSGRRRLVPRRRRAPRGLARRRDRHVDRPVSHG